jgi:flagellar biosynthesis protein FliR
VGVCGLTACHPGAGKSRFRRAHHVGVARAARDPLPDPPPFRGRERTGVAVRIDLSFLPALAAAFLLVFARTGTMLMLLPGLGEQNISARMRLTFALVLAAVLLPLHRSAYHVDPAAFGSVVVLLIEEMLIGAMLGVTARLTISALSVAGSVIAQQLGLGFVTAVDPTQGEQGVMVGNFLTILGITLFFATDMHHLVIAALNDSYNLFEPGDMPATGDAAALITRTVAGAFRIGIQLSAPFLVFGVLFNLGLGLLSRLMPQMQVFFVGLPLTILGGLLILTFVLGTMMTVFLADMRHMLGELAPHG